MLLTQRLREKLRTPIGLYLSNSKATSAPGSKVLSPTELLSEESVAGVLLFFNVLYALHYIAETASLSRGIRIKSRLCNAPLRAVSLPAKLFKHPRQFIGHGSCKGQTFSRNRMGELKLVSVKGLSA